MTKTAIFNHTVINNLEFAVSEQFTQHDIALDNLTRLSSLLQLNALGDVRYTLTGRAKQFGHPSLRLVIVASLPVICQRCLSDMHQQIALDFTYLIGNMPDNDSDEGDAHDWLDSSPEMDISALVEDELLLALPIAPKHMSDCKAYATESGEKPNPFAVLKDLVK